MANGILDWISDSRDYECENYTNPLIRAINWCPTLSIQPIQVTPAAPRSRAELTSGLWTPEDTLAFTWERWKGEQQKQRDMAGNGVNLNTPEVAPTPSNSTSDWILIGGMVIVGLVVIKAIKG